VEEKGTRTPFGELVKSRKAASDDTISSAYWVAIPKAGAVRAEMGAHLAIEALPKKPTPVKPAPFWERINYQFLNLFLVLFFLQAGFIVAANNFPYDTDVVADDLFKNPSRMAKFVIKPPEPQPKQAGGQKAAEPLLDVRYVVDAVLYMAGLPLEANVQFMTVLATKMPFVGRG